MDHSGDTSSLISKNSQRSMTSVLAMQRTRRQRLEYQRKKSVFAASEFGIVLYIYLKYIHVHIIIFLSTHSQVKFDG